MKPIEPGCLALVTGCIEGYSWSCPEMVGLTCRVIGKVEPGIVPVDLWSVLPPSELWRVELAGNRNLGCLERHLLRIDGGDELVEQEQEEEISA